MRRRRQAFGLSMMALGTAAILVPLFVIVKNRAQDPVGFGALVNALVEGWIFLIISAALGGAAIVSGIWIFASRSDD